MSVLHSFSGLTAVLRCSHLSIQPRWTLGLCLPFSCCGQCSREHAVLVLSTRHHSQASRSVCQAALPKCHRLGGLQQVLIPLSSGGRELPKSRCWQGGFFLKPLLLACSNFHLCVCCHDLFSVFRQRDRERESESKREREREREEMRVGEGGRGRESALLKDHRPHVLRTSFNANTSERLSPHTVTLRIKATAYGLGKGTYFSPQHSIHRRIAGSCANNMFKL